MSCVNVDLQEFKQLQQELNLDQATLKQIVHTYQMNNGDDSFPTKGYIKSKLYGTAVEFGENSYKLWKNQFSQPIIVSSEEYKKFLDGVNNVFPREAVVSYKNNDGTYTISVAKPTNAYLEEAKRDSQGRLLAPNGKPSNLTEKQFVQVRTPQFINWFGDWVNNPAEASKVVDENGEPLVVYHGSPNTWSIYNPDLFGTTTDEGYYGKGLYLSAIKNKAEQYGNIISLFVNIRKPIRVGIDNNISMKEARENITLAENFNRNGDLSNNDGVLYSGGEGRFEEIVVPTANQIKSATDNTGEFSTEDNNIYKSEEGYSAEQVKLKSKNTWRELVKNYPELEALSPEQARVVQDQIEKHVREEATKAVHTSVYNEYFDAVNQYGYSFSTVEEVLDKIINSTTDSDVKALAEFAKKYVNPEVSKIGITYSHRSNKSERGSYKAVDREITIHKNAASGVTAEQAKVNFEKVILHEIVHAITVDYLASDAEARGEIAGIMIQLQNAMDSGDKNLRVYALKSPAEFVAEFMSKPSLREATKLIPYQESKKNLNVFQKILSIIKNALRKLTGKQTTLYTKASKAIDNIFEKSFKYQGEKSTERYSQRDGASMFSPSYNRTQNLAIVKEHYGNVIRERVTQQHKEIQQQIKAITKNVIQPVSEYQSEEDFRERIDNIRKDINSRIGWALQNISFKPAKYGRGVILYPKLKTVEELIEAKLSMFDRYDSESLAAEALRLEQESSIDDAYYINPKKVPELKAQVLRKTTFTENNIEQAFQFLQELENDPDLNKYVSQCISWLKNSNIRLPEDHEKIIGAFKAALAAGLDTQSFKSPIDILIAVAKGSNIEEGTSVNPNKIPQFTFNRTIQTEKGQIQIYDVEDSEAGQQAVIDVLIATSPKIGTEHKPIGNSPWCLTTFTSTGKATESAKHFWESYDQGKRQIAFLNGAPLAFNSSSLHRDEWWDFYDGEHNGFKGYSSVEECDTESSQNFYKKLINNSGIRRVRFGNTHYVYTKDGNIVSVENFVKFLNDNNKLFRYRYQYTPETHYCRIDSHDGNLEYTYSTNTLELNLHNVSKGIDRLLISSRYPSINIGNYRISLRKNGVGIGNQLNFRGVLVIKNEDIPVNILQFIDKIKNTEVPTLNSKIIHTVKDQQKVTKFIKSLYSIVEGLNVESIGESLQSWIKEVTKQDESMQIDTPKKITLNEDTRQEAEDSVITSNIVNAVNQLSTTLNTIDDYAQGDTEYIEISQEVLNDVGQEVEQITNNEETTQTVEEIQPRTIIDTLQALKEGKLQQLYNEKIDQPFMKDLETLLGSILKEYHFEVLEGELKEVFGEDTLGAIDFFQKLVYVANEGERNAITLPEEFAHAFIELMGGAYRRNRKKYPASKEYSELRDLIQETSLYKQTFEEYKSIYTYKNGTPDEARIKKEALGKALASVITDRFEAKTKEDKSFISKVKAWFKNVLQFFKGIFNKEEKLIGRLNKIADSIIDGTYAEKYLTKLDDTDYKLVEFKDTLVKQTEKDEGKALNIIQQVQKHGALIGGSLSLRAQGTLYRPNSENLHDLDFTVSEENHEIFTRYPRLRYARPYYNTEYYSPERLRNVIAESDYIQKLKSDVPQLEVLAAYPSTEGLIANCIICDNVDLVNKFAELTGSYSDRLSQFTQEERDQIYLVDLFFRKDKVEATTAEEYQMTPHEITMEAKLRMGRAKDIYDYQRWNPKQRQYKISPSVMYQKKSQSDSVSPDPQEAKEVQDIQKQEQMKQQEIKKQQESRMLEQIYRINEQYNRILASKALTGNDIAEVSRIIVELISDKIDELEANRDQVKEILNAKNPNDNTDVNKLSRAELINAIGIQHFIDLVQRDFIRNKRVAEDDNIPKITEVIKNWDYFINRSKSLLYNAEGIHLEIDETGAKKADINESVVDQYEEDGTNIQDQIEDGQLSWQVENNTIDPIDVQSQLVKKLLRGLYEKKDSGRKDEEGNTVYNNIKTKWGTDARVGQDRAAKILYNWISDVQSLAGMVKVLEGKAKKYPWVNQLLPILTDTSGKYTTEQSQFFSTFYRPFRKFSNVGLKDGKLTSRSLNEHPFLTLTMKTIEASYKLGQHPLVSKGLKAGANALNNHYTTLEELVKNFDANKDKIFEELRAVTKGLGFEIDVAELGLEEGEVAELMHNLNFINNAFKTNANNESYDPFTYDRRKMGVRSNFMRFFKKLTDSYEEEAVTSFYEGGKMRQSYLLPSYISMFVNKFHLDEEAFNSFILSEFDTEFMRDSRFMGNSSKEGISRGWNNVWLQHMMSDKNKRKAFNCKTSITFHNGRESKVYMKGMTAQEYALAMITEFYGENSKESDSLFLANFRVIIESNKPSAEYITFYARGGSHYKDDLVSDFLKVFNQELSRIKTVNLREKNRTQALTELKVRYDKKEITAQQYKDLVYQINETAITNFDKRGKQFLYLDFLNSEIENKTELGKLLEEAMDGKKVDEALLSQKVSEAINAAIQARVDKMITDFRENGVFESCKKIAKIGTSDEAVQNKLEIMLWNDAFAATQIMQLLITDPAFLKNTDDVQKRFAQVHSSGNRANTTALDFDGNPVSDGVHRSITLKDVKGIASNIIENLTIVLDKKIAEATGANKVAWEAFKDKLIGTKGLFRTEINLTDAQAYSSPSSYRKKAYIFGLWSKEAEETYKRIREGNYTLSDVVSVFQPFKPFLYGNSIEDTGVVGEGAMTKMRVPVQNKNAECLLVMADAILAGEDTGKPNLLRALFQVMEDSHYENIGGERVYKVDGIDTVNFESAVKSGAQGRVDTRAYEAGREGKVVQEDNSITNEIVATPEEAFKQQLESIIYKTSTINGKEVRTYNRKTVKHMSFENYCMQQSVPEHFLDHSQLEGSQQRALIPSDLASTYIDENGETQTVYYEVGENKTKMTAEELRERYDQLHADNIRKGVEEIEEMFMLKESTPQQRKEALSRLLVQQFLKDGRYSGDMLYLVTINKETGDFPISLEDPSIRTQVEQAINSIIKKSVNKPKMKGGPLVQMSNFGMSKELKIRFLDKDGNLLKERSEFESDKAYKEYITKNQKGIAHFEVIAPAYTETIFKEFMDSEGNISVEALELLNPDLLRMIGYRIPTEAKYSIAPLKIVGFAPREMGDVIILPAEITMITGSDFDVDKEYCLRKTLDIIHKIGLTKEERALREDEQVAIRADKASSKLAYELNEINKEKTGHSRHSTIKTFAERFVRDPYNKKLWLSEGFTEAQYKDILKRYVNIVYKVRPAKGVDANNNDIFDLSYAVLTHESNVARALKPGGFDEHKHLAYAIASYRLPEVRETYPDFDTLLNMDTDALGALIERKDKNLIYLDTQLEYYDHNNSASSLLGISAVNSVAHAILVDDNIGIDLTDSVIPVRIAGFDFKSTMRLDPSESVDGTSIAEILGSCVAASADAAKDPVLDLMNLNPQTFNVYTTLVRLGVPNSISLLIMSSNVLRDAIKEANAKTLAGMWATPESILRESISGETLGKIGYSLESPIFREEITREELINSIYDNANQIDRDRDNIELKITNFLVNMFSISRKVRLADQVTRFNSISSAVGPTAIDNYIFESKLRDLNSESSLVDLNTGEHIGVRGLLDKHKTLAEFSKGYNLARKVLMGNMPQARAFFESVENILAVPTNVVGLDIKMGLPDVVRNDRSLMGKARDFFTSWNAVRNNLISHDELKFLSSEFPKVISTKKAEHKDNYLVQNLYLNIDNRSGFPIVSMNISMIDKNSRDLLSAAWADLYAKDKDFAVNLFKYSFVRGGLGFSPKTFMSVLPIQMKLDMPGYAQLFKDGHVLTSQESTIFYKQFISNNYMDNKLVPLKKATPKADGSIVIPKTAKNSGSFKNARYFKTEKDGIIRLWECTGGHEEGPIYRTYKEIPKLGAEGNFIEISPRNINKSVFDLTFEQAEDGSMGLTPDVNDILTDRRATIVEAKKLLDKALTQDQQTSTKNKVAQLEGQHKEAFISRATERLTTRLKEDGYTPIKEDVFKEMLKLLDLC